MLPPTSLDVSGERLSATYLLTGDPGDAERRAEAICIEQTIEFPADLVPDDDIRGHVFGRVEAMEQLGDEQVEVQISYAVETTGFELPQLLNVLFGNSSLQHGIRLMDLDLPDVLLAHFPGPRFGVAGLREMFDAPERPLLATATKPMGLSPEDFARMAGDLALGGIDMIKDDHGLADQSFARYEQRVRLSAEAVRDAAAHTGHPTIYLPSINASHDLLEDRVRVAVDAGVGGLLVLPGLTGFDHMRHLGATTGLPIMGHPALLGSFVSAGAGGIDHGVLFGTVMRLAGADASIFPNFGGRFSFSKDACRAIAGACLGPFGEVSRAFPTPGGGMTLDRVGEMMDFYSRDVILLIGGDLHRGENLTRTVAAFRESVEG